MIYPYTEILSYELSLRVDKYFTVGSMNKISKLVMLTAFFFALSGCNDQEKTKRDSANTSKITAQNKLWKSVRPDFYWLEIGCEGTLSCGLSKTDVRIENQIAIEGYDYDESVGVALNNQQLLDILTIEKVFSLLENEIIESRYVFVEFDAEIGYPKKWALCGDSECEDHLIVNTYSIK